MAMQLYLQNFTLILEILVLFVSVSAETYYITLTPNITCPNENVTCLTLIEYAQQTLETAPSLNITLTFAPGNHYLDSNLIVQYRNEGNLNLLVEHTNSSSLPVAMVTCASSGFTIEGLTEVSISGLEFNGCTENTVQSVDQFRLDGCRFHTGHGIELERVKNATIDRSSFVSLTGRRTEITLLWQPYRKIAVAGAAIVTRQSTVTINECQFDGNIAINGGVIYLTNANIEINMSNFTNNSADEGGVIDGNNGTVTIHDSTFIDNIADAGGVIDTDSSGDVDIHITIQFKSCMFINNTAVQGGTIWAGSANITIQESTFINNTAARGSVLYAYRSIVTLSTTNTFINNRADYGGVIDAYYSDDTIIAIHYTEDLPTNTCYITPTPNITCPNENVTCLTLTEYAQQSLQTAPGSNIALSFAPGNHTLSSNLWIKYLSNLMLQVTETNNSSFPVATVICNDTGFMFEGILQVSISGLEFNGCRKNTVRSVDQFRLEGCRFHIGHGIEILRIKNATIERSSFVSLMGKESKVWWESTGSALAGGALVTRYSTVVINECQIDRNTADYGGSIYSEYSDLEINTCNFTNNTADYDGGAIDAHNGTITLQYSAFVGNRVTYGGAIEIDNVTITILECSFINNEARWAGGVIDHDTTNGTIVVRNSIFTGNSASVRGGVMNTRHDHVYHRDITIIITTYDSTFSSNAAGRGAVFDVYSTDIIIEHSVFTNNMARYGPGSIIKSNFSAVTICNSTFNSNTAVGGHGGVIDTDNGNTVIYNSTFITNTADNGGGAISADWDNTTIQDSVFINNTAQEYGGAICVGHGSITIRKSQFSNNTAIVHHGGAIEAYKDASISIQDSGFFYNTAAGSGGAVTAERNSNVTMNYCMIFNNVAELGGAIGADTSHIDLQNTKFSNNTATSGGALYATNANIEITNCVFSAEIRPSNVTGTVVSADSGTTIFMNNITLINNTATFDGTFYTQGDTTFIIHCTDTEDILAEIYYITTTPNITCPTCLTLEEYIKQSLETAPGSNISLIFAPGNHHLRMNLQIEYKKVKNLLLNVSESVSWNSTSPYAMVNCNNSRLAFEGTSHSEVSISGLEFNGCTSTVRSVDQFRLEGCRFHTGHGIELERIKNATIERSSFVSLTGRETKDVTIRGGAVVVRNSNAVTVCECQFDSNMAAYGGSIHSEYSNLLIIIANFTNNIANLDGGVINAESSTITVHDSTFIGNTAKLYGGAIEADNVNITIYDSTFSYNEATYGGTVDARNASIVIFNSIFLNNRGNDISGGVIEAKHDTCIAIYNSIFSYNQAKVSGGVIEAEYETNITIYKSTFSYNQAEGGGVIDVNNGSSVFVCNSTFFNNQADIDGGVINVDSSTIAIADSEFTENIANHNGGVIEAHTANISITQNSVFINNKAKSGYGGAINAYSGTITIEESSFLGNTATRGGVIRVCSFNNTVAVNIYNSVFINNTAEGYAFMDINFVVCGHQTTVRFNIISNVLKENSGGVIWTDGATDMTIHSSEFTNNTAKYGATLAFQDLGIGANTVSLRDCIFNNNSAYTQGGAMWVQSTNLTSNGFLQITNNRAPVGIVYAIESTLLFSGNTNISNNYHGSQYPLISQTSVTFNGNTNILNNFHSATLVEKARSQDIVVQPSDMILRGTVDLSYNRLYNKPQAKELTFTYLYIFPDSTIYIPTSSYTALFSGGDCVYQLKLIGTKVNVTNTVEKIIDRGEGVYSLITISQLHFSRLTVELVHLCFCRNDQLLHDCSTMPPTIRVKRGHSFNVSLVAVDQYNNPIPHTVSAFLSSSEGRLEGDTIQSTNILCKDFTYTIFSSNVSEQLVLNLYSPCSNLGISQTQVSVLFLPCNCPIGFTEKAQELSNCVCVCDPDIFPEHISNCSYPNESVQRKDNRWISYINTTDQKGYLIHPHCPFDYCRPSTEQVWINLNVPNEADAQCAFNRSGKLCGSCEEGLSLSLGSSRCKKCSNNWLALLIVFALAGVALVAFLLVCNLTVAVGTINGLIFYVNILTTNRATFFPVELYNFFTIFIAWLNLDFGFVTCFYNGMDDYAKTWLQLAFPLYIIFLVAMVIIAGEFSEHIANILTKTNPVATLATLILLCYAKSLRVIVAALSLTTLEYPDGTREVVWLTDANIRYFEGKHIPLFLVALLIVLVGIAYTLFLFSYQWLLLCASKKPLKWIKNARIFPFMDAYHSLYCKNHRYWTGLLLFVRVFLYLAVTLNESGDPSFNLFFISSTIASLCLLKMLLAGRIYKSWPLDALENSFIFNLLIFSVATVYNKETGGNQAALAYTSTSVAFVTFIIIVLYHTYTFVLPKKLRNKLDSIKHKAPTDVDNDNLIPAQKNQCTYSVVDPIPPPPKTLAELKECCKAKVKNDLEEENEPKSPSLISSKDASKNTAHTTGQNNEQHQVNIELMEIPADRNENDFKLKLNTATNECKTSNVEIVVEPYIADIDQRGLEREAELNECMF